MKNILNYLYLMGIALLFHACDSDLEKVTYDYTQAIPAVLEKIDDSYILESAKADETALTLKWEAPDMKYSTAGGAATTNYIELDLAGKNFAHKMTLGATTGQITEQTFTHAELNGYLIKLLKNEYETDIVKNPNLIKAYDFEIRIQSSIAETSTPVFSNILHTKITPFSTDVTYPAIYIIGDYCGWNWDHTQSLFSFKENEEYEGIIHFGEKASNGFKLAGAKSWDTSTGNWGLESKDQNSAEASKLQLVNDGGSANIECYSKHYYRFHFNKLTLELKKDLAFNVLSICGDAGEEITGWGAKEKDMSFDATKQCFYADVKLKDGEIKFRADHDWQLSFGSKTEGLLDSGDNIKVKAGNYRIYVNLNNSTNQTYELNTEDYGK